MLKTEKHVVGSCNQKYKPKTLFCDLSLCICHCRFLVDLEKLIKYKEEAQR